MASSKQHPHASMPSDDELRVVIRGLQPRHEDLYLAVHRLVVDVVPDVRFEVDLVDGSTGYGARQYGYGGWGMAALQAHTGWVSLHLMQGAALPDPDGVLQGGGKQLRHVKLRSTDDLATHAGSLRALVEAARRHLVG